MVALWILLTVFGFSASIYNFYEFSICPIPSNEDPFIRKDNILLLLIFFFGLGILAHGITGLCLHFTGPNFMEGLFGGIVVIAIILVFLIACCILKKCQKQLSIQKKKSQEMSRISKNKSIYYFFLILVFSNCLSAIPLKYAENYSINGLYIGIYIFNLCSLIASVFLLFYHRYIQNKQK